MYPIRLCFAFLHMAFTAFCLIPVVVLRPLHRDNMYMAARTVARGSAWIFGVRYVVENETYLTPQQPSVIIGNHQDTLDMFFATHIVRSGVVALGKRELLYIPFIGLAFYLAGNILVNRQHKAQAKAALEKAVAKMQRRNMSVLIFPEGTRNWGKPLPFKMGAFNLAITGQYPIVPVVFALRPQTLNLRQWRWHCGEVYIRALPPISTQGMTQEDAKALAASCQHLIEQETLRLSAEHTSTPTNPA